MAGRGGGNVRVSITGDAAGLKRATRDGEGALERLNRTGRRVFTGLGRAAAAGGAALTGGVVLGLKFSADAAIDAEKAAARLNAQLNTLGKNSPRVRAQIDEAVQALSRLSGFDDEDLQDSFVNIVRTTGNVSEALELNALAADLARAKQIDVAKAGEIVAKVAGGNVGILGRYGIQLERGATASEALAALQQRVAGQAEEFGETTAGATDRAKVGFENLAEAAGGALTPAIADGAEAAAKFVDQIETGTGAGGRFRDTVLGIGQVVGPAALGIGRFVVDVVRLGVEFGQTRVGMTLLGAAAGALTGRMIALGVTFAVGKVASFVTALGGLRTAALVVGTALVQARTGLIGFNAAAAGTGLGALVVVIGTVVGALAGMKAGTDQTKTSAEQLNAALNRQHDALRQLRDMDIDVAQRKANLRAANIAVEQAERRLTAARRAHGRSSLEAKQAENDLEQARIQQTRAQRELSRADEDGTRARREASDATRSAAQTARDRIRTLRQEIAEIQRDITFKGANRQRTEALAAKQRELARETEKLATSIRNIPNRKRTSIDVGITFNGQRIPGLRPLEELGPSGGPNIEEMLTASAQAIARDQSKRLAGTTGLDGTTLLARQFGLGMTSGYRPGDPGWHGRNRARDYAGPPGQMLRFARYVAGAFGPRLLELIHTPLGFGIKNGQRVPPYARADHYDHVHVAMQRGGIVPGSGSGDKVPVAAMLEPGEVFGVLNRKAAAAVHALNGIFPRFQRGGVLGIGELVALAQRAGFRGTAAARMAAEAMGESGGRVNARGDRGKSHGLWQIHTGYWPDLARRYNLFSAWGNAQAARQVFLRSGRSFAPWHANHAPHMAAALRALRGGGGDRRRGGGGFLPDAPGGILPEAFPVPADGAGKAGRAGGKAGLAPSGLLGDPAVGAGSLDGGSESPGDEQARLLIEATDRSTAALNALREEVRRNNEITGTVLATGWREAVRFMADAFSGEVVGHGVIPRAATAGAGTVARF